MQYQTLRKCLQCRTRYFAKTLKFTTMAKRQDKDNYLVKGQSSRFL